MPGRPSGWPTKGLDFSWIVADLKFGSCRAWVKLYCRTAPFGNDDGALDLAGCTNERPGLEVGLQRKTAEVDGLVHVQA